MLWLFVTPACEHSRCELVDGLPKSAASTSPLARMQTPGKSYAEMCNLWNGFFIGGVERRPLSDTR